ncbi:hypothetical protein YC2023_011609 [Brassica napus]
MPRASLGLSSQSIASGFLRFWDSLNFKKDREFVGIMVLFLDEKVNFVIHGFTPVGRANHYMPSLKADSIVKVDRFEVVRCSSMYKIIDHPFLICFISLTIIDEVIKGAVEINLQSRLDYVVGQIRSVQGSDLTKETTRVVIRLLIDPLKETTITQTIKETTATPGDTKDNPNRHKAATTSPPNHSFCLMKIAYMLNINRPLLLSSYEKYIYSFKTH